NFVRVFRKTHEKKWKELGSLRSIRLEFKNKRARASIDRWLKKESDEKYTDPKSIYSRVSGFETIAVILVVISVALYLLHFIFTGKL
ncbi:MAG: hypothetical protein PVG75_10285, partial [Thioalkalispiraceae bacterium]